MDSFFDFIKEHPPVKRLQVNDLLLAEYQCPLAETRYDIWSHHNYFIYVISGKKKWYTRNQEMLVQEGDCLFVRKGAHSVYQFFDTEFCALVLFVPDDFIRSVLIDNQIKTGSQDDYSGFNSLFSVDPGRQVDTYFKSFFAYLTGSQNPGEALMELKFKELIIVTATSAGSNNLRRYFASLCKTAKPSLRDVMENNFTYPMKLDELARLSGRSLSAFKRDFTSDFGTTPGRWLREKRLNHARYLLENTDKSVTETAFESGFKNNSHFNRVFKEHFGMTPLECSKTGEIADN
jgi:AraC family transcriptional regulator, exoenzyme S synthesis regulatory protein ExsA